MKIDNELARELKKAQGDGSREAKFALLRRVSAACADLSKPDVRTTFYDTVKKHGRVPVIICVAATLEARKERLEGWGISWAREVLEQLRGWTAGNLERANINDGIHPTAICEYAYGLIQITTEE